MTTRYLISRIFVAQILFLLNLAQAAVPLWSFTPLTPTRLTIDANGFATIQYMVTNQSRKIHTLVMTPVNGISQITTTGNCANPFTLAYQQSCKLTLEINGSMLKGNVVGGPVACQQGNLLQCYQPSAADSLNITRSDVLGETILNASVSTLTLSVNDTGTNLALTGHSRTIAITNNGSNTAINVAISSSGLPPETNISTTCTGSLTPNLSCTITVQPGPNATSNCRTGIAPTPGVITISAGNANTLQTSVVVLTYGCIYQGGFVFSIDDNTTPTGSISGKIAAQTDTVIGQTVPSFSDPNWGGNGTDIGTALWDTSPQGANDGATNSAAIVSTLTPPTPLSIYAAGLCSQLAVDGSNVPCTLGDTGCYSGWYLPAICELGPFSFSPTCATGSTNIQQQLFEANPTISNLNLVDNAYYWSSTEFSLGAAVSAWFELFNSGGGSFQSNVDKTLLLGVRCSREFNP